MTYNHAILYFYVCLCVRFIILYKKKTNTLGEDLRFAAYFHKKPVDFNFQKKYL